MIEFWVVKSDLELSISVNKIIIDNWQKYCTDKLSKDLPTGGQQARTLENEQNLE